MEQPTGETVSALTAVVAGDGGHTVQLYERSSFLFDRVSAFLTPGLKAGQAALVIARPAHRRAIDARLRADGIDVAAERDAGSYLDLDAADTLDRFTVNGWIDRTLFVDVVGGAIARVRPRARFPVVRAFGEMVAVLWDRGEHEAAIRLEELWNELLGHHPFSLLCGYSVDSVGRADPRSFARIMAVHSSVEHPEGR